MNLKIYCDGGARGNPGPAAWAFIAYNNENEVIAQKNGKMGVATNNIAEYTALVNALGWLKEERQKQNEGSIEKTAFFLDSQLVVCQLNGLFKVKNPGLRELIVQIRQAEQEAGGNIFYQHIPREKNTAADFLVNQALDAP